MPLFGNKFSPKKTPLRKSHINVNSDKLLEDLVGEQRSIKINLGGQELVFQNGQWIPGKASNAIYTGKKNSWHKLQQKLAKKNQDLQEENNLLRIKYELVLDMLTQTTAERELLEKEFEKLKKVKN